jgi:hypothetical protein
MTRYEEILTRLVVAVITRGTSLTWAVESIQLREAAATLEMHFQERASAAPRGDMTHEDVPLSALLKPQAG